MISIRYSSETKPNSSLQDTPSNRRETNSKWLLRVGATDGVILLGGSSLADFRIRVAQSLLRGDMLPSFWSQAGVLTDGQTFASVPLDLGVDISEVPRANGVQACRIKDYDDPERFPNIAVLRFTNVHGSISDNIERIKSQRSVVDLPNLILPWLGYVWGVGQQGNPLVEGKGLPSAVFVEMVYGIAGIELTPGLSSASSCPEAIWQSAKWWHPFYEKAAGTGDALATTIVPTGNFAIRQPAAAVIERRK